MAAIAGKLLLFLRLNRGEEPSLHRTEALLGMGRNAKTAAAEEAAAALKLVGAPVPVAGSPNVASGVANADDEAALSSLAWSADGAHVVTGDDNGDVRIWRVTKQAAPSSEIACMLVATFHAHDATVNALAWSSAGVTGSWIVSACVDGSVKTWRFDKSEVKPGGSIASKGASEVGSKGAPKDKRGPNAGKPNAGRWFFRRIVFEPVADAVQFVALESSQRGAAILSRWTLLPGAREFTCSQWRLLAFEPLSAMDVR